MDNAAKDKALYRQPGSDVLRNRFGITGPETLDLVERVHVTRRIIQGPPKGDFDLGHLKAIHHHLFQDVYEWAGDIRQVDMNKGGLWFHPQDRIEMGMADIHKRLLDQDYLRGRETNVFAEDAAQIIGDLNALHPFRDGNGRTQLQYLKQLGDRAFNPVDLTKFKRDSWIDASVRSHHGDYEPMQRCIERAMVPELEKVKSI